MTFKQDLKTILPLSTLLIGAVVAAILLIPSVVHANGQKFAPGFVTNANKSDMRVYKLVATEMLKPRDKHISVRAIDAKEPCIEVSEYIAMPKKEIYVGR